MICGICNKALEDCECEESKKLYCSNCKSTNLDLECGLMEWGYVVTHWCKDCGYKYVEDL